MRSFHVDPSRLALYLIGGIVLGWYLLAHATSESLMVFAMLILLVYLSIPACCQSRK